MHTPDFFKHSADPMWVPWHNSDTLRRAFPIGWATAMDLPLAHVATIWSLPGLHLIEAQEFWHHIYFLNALSIHFKHRFHASPIAGQRLQASNAAFALRAAFSLPRVYHSAASCVN